MFNCRHMTRMISEGLDRSLSFWERVRLAVHVLGCPPCARFRRAVEGHAAGFGGQPSDGFCRCMNGIHSPLGLT